MTESDLNQLSAFNTKKLRRIPRIFWPETLQPTSSRPLQPRQHGHHHRSTAIKMDGVCDGSTLRHDGGAGSNIRNRLNKARNAVRMLIDLWKSSQYSTKTKLRLYQSCISSTLLYGSECWRMTESDLSQLATFNTKKLRRILRILWTETISNQHHLARAAATKTAWAPSSCVGDGDESDMWWEESQATSPAQPFTGHQRGSGNGSEPRTLGVEL